MRYLLVTFEDREIREVLPYNQPAVVPPAERGSYFCRTGRAKYLATVGQLLKHIQRGDIYEINYCIEFFATGAVIEPQAVFNRLNELTGAPFAGIYSCGSEVIICASPERFLKKEGGRLVTQPMKGTAPRGEDPKQDALLKQALATSLKEQTENVMALDVARNDLSVIARKGSVTTTALFGVQTFNNVHQMVSTAECELDGATPFSTILRATFPPASMTGAPKLSACRLINRYEDSARGVYAGCLGWMNDAGDFDLCVVIRTIRYNPGQKRLSFHVGSAITAASDPEKEWEECLLKAGALLQALGVSLRDVNFMK